MSGSAEKDWCLIGRYGRDRGGDGRGIIELEEVDRILYIGLSMKLQLHAHAPYRLYLYLTHRRPRTVEYVP